MLATFLEFPWVQGMFTQLHVGVYVQWRRDGLSSYSFTPRVFQLVYLVLQFPLSRDVSLNPPTNASSPPDWLKKEIVGRVIAWPIIINNVLHGQHLDGVGVKDLGCRLGVVLNAWVVKPCWQCPPVTPHPVEGPWPHLPDRYLLLHQSGHR